MAETTNGETRAPVYKVKYIGGAGKELAYPLSNGMTSILAGQVIELSNYQDYVRLVGSPDFVEVKDTPNEPKETQKNA